MKIEWDEPPVSRRNTDSLWTKVKNSISVLKQTHDGPPPRHHSTSRGSSRSSSRPSTSRQSSGGTSRPSNYHQRSASAGPQRPYVTIATNGGPPQVVSSGSGQYGSAYIVQTASPIIYDPRYNSPSRPPVVSRRSTAPLSPSPLRSSTATSPRPRPQEPRRSNTTPHSSSSSHGTGGTMYNGKLIVGDPDEVSKYISTQKRIENWCKEVR